MAAFYSILILAVAASVSEASSLCEVDLIGGFLQLADKGTQLRLKIRNDERSEIFYRMRDFHVAAFTSVLLARNEPLEPDRRLLLLSERWGRARVLYWAVDPEWDHYWPEQVSDKALHEWHADHRALFATFAECTGALKQ